MAVGEMKFIRRHGVYAVGIMSICINNKKIRSTREAEIQRMVFQDDYGVYSRIKESADLKRYCELEGYVNTLAFREKRKKIEHLVYRESECYRLEKKYKSLLKSPQLRAYYLMEKSSELKNYLKIRESKLYLRYAALRDQVRRGVLNRRAYPEKYAEYKQLEKQEALKEAIALEGKRKFVYYLKVKESGLPTEFEKLRAYVESETFRQEKRFLLDRNRYETTEDYKSWCEYEILKKRPDIIRYFLLSTDECFQDMCHWELVFEEKFTAGKPDQEKWLLLQEEGRNVPLKWGRREGKIEGEGQGCGTQLSTALSFRQCYGKFEAKIKLTNSSVEQCFGLKGEADIPRIEILKGSKDGIYMGNIVAPGRSRKNTLQLLNGLKYTEDYYIFSLEWTPERMVWKINDALVKEVVKDIPAIPLYLVLGVGGDDRQQIADISFPEDVEWIKCYKRKY